MGTSEPIRIHNPSETATLRKVVVGFVKPFTWQALLRGGAWDWKNLVKNLFQLISNRVRIPDAARASRQHQAFLDLLVRNGVEVLAVDDLPDVPIQLYTRDIGFVIDDVFFCARSRHPSRRREQQGLEKLLRRFARVAHLDAGIIEGGDVMVDYKHVLVGVGEETDLDGVQSLRRKMKELGIDREVVPLPFRRRGVTHLDTQFAIVAEGIGLVYPKSFTHAALGFLEKHYDLVEVTRAEMNSLEINIFTLDARRVILRERSDRLCALLESRGVEVFRVDYSEVAKFPGSLHCATLPIQRGEV